ncbi:MAG TPA: 50S ribosomal protein L2 [Candidatus Nanoarchaeia archaeon]|nr:50S ribosomal protein L2 [Candidatus Nanoarchaeia archaeon]
MGKRIIVQARGHGSKSYRVRNNAYKYKIKYPSNKDGEGIVLKLQNSTAHTAPLAKVKMGDQVFYMPAFKGMLEGQKIKIGGDQVQNGNILILKNIPVKTHIYCIESRPGDGGVFIKTGGSYATISRIIGEQIYVLMPSKQERSFNSNCRAVIGVISGDGRLDKPIIKAGKMFFIRKSRNKLWPRTSAVKMNAIDHPFGSGRGKRIKSKIAKRNAPAGARVGLIRPSRTGKKR